MLIPVRLTLQCGHVQAYHFRCDCIEHVNSPFNLMLCFSGHVLKCWMSFFTLSSGTTCLKTRTLWPTSHWSCTACRFAKLWFTYKERRWYTGTHIWVVCAFCLYLWPVTSSNQILSHIFGGGLSSDLSSYFKKLHSVYQACQVHYSMVVHMSP